MKKEYYIPIIALILTATNGFAQTNATKKADNYYDRLEYVKAVEKYQTLVEDGNGDAHIYKRLGNCYYNLYNTKSAALYYGMYLKADPTAEGEVIYRYAQMLKANGDFDQSNATMQQFASKSPNDDRAKAFLAHPDYLSKLLNAAPKYRADKSTFNTELSDFGGYEKGGKLYFVSARNTSRMNYGWNGQPTLDVYVASKAGGTYNEAQLLEGDVNSKFNEGTVSITEDGKTMYFTRNDYLDGDYEKDSEGIGQLKIYKARLIDGKWKDIQSLPFNNSEYSTGHTALSPDGKTLYFSSDMPGGSGMSDLYKVDINDDGSFGEPKNLGSGINTVGRESFPFVDSEGTLYFSSDGQLGMGGLDVFFAKAEGDGFGKVANMCKPVNSTGDDFAFTLNLITKEGYVSSNRGDSGDGANAGNDNIYKITEMERPCEVTLIIKIINQVTGELLAQTEVSVSAEKGDEKNQTTEKQGSIEFKQLECEGVYWLIATKVGYKFYEERLTTKSEETQHWTIALEPMEKEIVGDQVVLNSIHFEFDKSEITPLGALELDRLVEIMNNHPEMVIKVEAYTDNKGSTTYNQQLSERRAKSTVDYIVSKGIDATRISGEGFGEKNPKIDCSNSCTEEQHQMNRRSVFRIVEK